MQAETQEETIQLNMIQPKSAAEKWNAIIPSTKHRYAV
jgi:hypothetical protein